MIIGRINRSYYVFERNFTEIKRRWYYPCVIIHDLITKEKLKPYAAHSCSIPAKRITTQILVTVKLNGKKDLILKGFVCNIIGTHKELPVQS